MKDNNTRTLIAIDDSIVERIEAALFSCEKQLEKGRKAEADLRLQIDNLKPITQAEAAHYLNVTEDSLRYYRTMGLDSFKKGASRWYTKAIIDAWLATGKVNRHER